MKEDNSLNHVAFIMDGNRRWSKKTGLDLLKSYSKGADKIIEIIEECIENKISYASFYAFSHDNFNRSAKEISYIKQILLYYLNNKVSHFYEKSVKFVCFGDYSKFGKEIDSKIKDLEEKTKNFTSMTVCMYIGYGGKQEIVRAVNNIISKNIDNITEETISKELFTKDIPDPDLIIRTGGFQRLSNFLLWQASYSELFFSDSLWPDFTKDELLESISSYKKIERKKGL